MSGNLVSGGSSDPTSSNYGGKFLERGFINLNTGLYYRFYKESDIEANSDIFRIYLDYVDEDNDKSDVYTRDFLNSSNVEARRFNNGN